MKLTAADGHAETELHSAAWNGDIEWANELIEKDKKKIKEKIKDTRKNLANS